MDWESSSCCSYDSKTTTGFVHLVNQGATDYLNAMVSALFMIPHYRKVCK